MQIVQHPIQLRLNIERLRGDRKVSLVPTMGFFHEGHLQLFRAAREQGDLVVVSSYLNPTQFGLGEDLARYPRDLNRDAAMAEEERVDILFTPTDDVMYPSGTPRTWVRLENLEEKMCGRYRPGHFRGVATVVAKLFNMVRPDRAHFGEKDFQQVRVVEQMVKDLAFGIEVVRLPTVRENDGLAMSSRNSYLDSDERAAATILHKALLEGKCAAQRGERSGNEIKEVMEATLAREPLCRPQYAGVYDVETLDEIMGDRHGHVLLAVAAYVGHTRLFDNLVLALN